MAKSTRVNTKIRKKRPPETGTLVGVRLQADLLEPLDSWISEQPEPKPTRPEAIRKALTDWLTSLGLRRLDSDPKGKR